MELKCPSCGDFFYPPPKRIRYAMKRGQNAFYCSPACAGHARSGGVAGAMKARKEAAKQILCSHCGTRLSPKQEKELLKREGAGKAFCSRSCAASAGNAQRGQVDRDSLKAAITQFVRRPKGGRDVAWLVLEYENLYLNAARSAKRRGISMSLTPMEFAVICKRSDGRCEVSGIPFSEDRIEGVASFRRPYMPSLDRIDSTKGYDAGNCRLVCTSVNLAMNEWGADLFTDMLIRIDRARIADRKRAWLARRRDTA